MNPLTNGAVIMELASDIKDEAKALINAYLHESGTLPAKINKAYYVGKADDESILTHDAIQVSGVEYKIGTLKSK